MVRISIFAIIFFALMSCADDSNLSKAPSIEYLGISKDTIIQGRVLDDSLYIFISFDDDDGDIGDDDNEASLFLEDTRDGAVTPFSIPLVPEQGSSNGVSGEMTILVTTLFNVCCYFTNGLDPCSISADQRFDQMTYRIHITDRAGNESNVVETGPITIRCN